jgi:hypothetical protein
VRAKAAAMIEIAELRLRNIAPRSVAVLEALVTTASSEEVRLQAANSLVDRSVGRATERIHVAAEITVKRSCVEGHWSLGLHGVAAPITK